MNQTYTSNPQLELAYSFLTNTGKNLFLTGKAGTGKTTFLKNLRDNTFKRMVVVAPTGVAAINAGGVTIHSFFQVSFGPQVPTHYLTGAPKQSAGMFRFSREKLNIIRSLDLLVIDEISMVRADLLDAIDGVLRRFRNKTLPFGGVQVLMIGDLQQLAPVVKDSDWEVLRPHYAGPFFFQSKVLQLNPADTIELKHIYRQSDNRFINVLNEIRENRISQQTIDILNSRYIKGFEQSEGYITLCSHNRQADSINNQKLQAIASSPIKFKAEVEGDFPEFAYPNDSILILKTGAQVMFIKNDLSPKKLYYNGKIGRIQSIDDGTVFVECEGEDDLIAVEPVEWRNYKYSLNPKTNEIEESIIGKYRQIPLKTAWAITIHKSQGLTFEKAIIDANAAFAHGQVYVALSRCKTLEGMVLSSPIELQSIISSQDVNSFIAASSKNQPNAEKLHQYKLEYERELVKDLFGFETLWRRMIYLEKHIRENESVIFGTMLGVLQKLLESFKPTIKDVATKFDAQLHSLFAQGKVVADNPLLNERITKASRYFHSHLEQLVPPLINNASADTDNAAIGKIIKEQISRIEEEYTIRINCLKACFEEFTIESYLNARSISSIEKAKKPKRQRDKVESSASKNPELYSRLRQWRDDTADELDLPVYMVIQTKTMAALSDVMPQSIKELSKIKGLGKVKINRWGKDILNIIRDYCIDNNINIQELELANERTKGEEKSPNYIAQTIELFKKDLSIQEIAIKRGRSISTIEEHLVKGVEFGEIEAEKLVDSSKINRIKMWYMENNRSQLSQVKYALGDEYSYFEIKVALAAMKWEG